MPRGGKVPEAQSETTIENGMMKSLVAAFLLVVSLNGASALELSELLPCKSAAAKYCDRSGGVTMSSILRCGATLAAISHRVGPQCRQVLQRYGQL
jgi:hypothetical protein